MEQIDAEFSQISILHTEKIFAKINEEIEPFTFNF